MSFIRPKGRRYNSRKIPRGGGGVQKEAISEGVGVAYRGFLPGGLSKIGELLINNSFSVEQAISYFTVWPVFHMARY